jgi:restriction system protein
MVLRKATKGKNAGNEFWGCSAFPKCRSVVERLVEFNKINKIG